MCVCVCVWRGGGGREGEGKGAGISLEKMPHTLDLYGAKPKKLALYFCSVVWDREREGGGGGG